MICSSLNLVFFTSVSSRSRTLAQTGRASGEHVTWGGDARAGGRWSQSDAREVRASRHRGHPQNDGVSGRLTVLEQPVLIVVETQVVLVLVEED
jgi:hypothetical protein